MNEDFIQDGVLEDTRPIWEIDKDHTHEELYGGLPVVWVEKPQSQWKVTIPRNQANSFSCVKQSSATAMEKFLNKVISAGTYKLRKNAPDGGMYLQNCGDIDYNKGVILEGECKSQFMNDPELDAIDLTGKKYLYKITGYRTFDLVNIDKVAEAIQAYGNCIMTFGSNSQEWERTPIYKGTPVTFGHAICGIDFALVNGVKTIICMDSSGQRTSQDGIRLITEDFLNKRGKDAMYYLGVKKIEEVIELPPLTPTLWNQFMQFINAWKLLYGKISGKIK